MKLNFRRSNEIVEKAKKIMPGGVNSPVRSFSSVGGNPFVASKAEGPYLYDVDQNRYIDLVGSWGPMIHGHLNPQIIEAIEAAVGKSTSFGVTSVPEVRLCEKMVELVPSVEMIRLVNSGTEACMSAIRLARAYTKRNLILKFEGHYHGHGDSFLVSAGSGLATLGMSASAGVTEQCSHETIVIPFNNSEALENCFSKYGNQIAGTILELVTGNMGVVVPSADYIHLLRELCTKHSALMIADEVMTGFRLSMKGAQGLYNVEPDLSCFGKVIGGGLPVGAYGGKQEIMSIVAPLGPMYQAGTLSGNPLASAAGLKCLELIQEDEKLFFQTLDSRGSNLADYLRAHIEHKDYPVSIAQAGSMLTVFFRKDLPKNYQEAKESNTQLFSKFFWALLERGVYYPPSQFEACFLSMAHDQEIMDRVAGAICEALDESFKN